jgi:hypothetical protein
MKRVIKIIMYLIITIVLIIAGTIGGFYILTIYKKNIFVERIINQEFDKIIDLDKKTRKFNMKREGIPFKTIEKKIQALEHKYNYERNKMWRYCKNSDDRCHIHSKLSKRIDPGAVVLFNYKMDRESLKFFNQRFVTEEFYNGKRLLLQTVGIDLKCINLEYPYHQYRDHYIYRGIEYKTIKKLNSEESKKYYMKKKGY